MNYQLASIEEGQNGGDVVHDSKVGYPFFSNPEHHLSVFSNQMERGSASRKLPTRQSASQRVDHKITTPSEELDTPEWPRTASTTREEDLEDIMAAFDLTKITGPDGKLIGIKEDDTPNVLIAKAAWVVKGKEIELQMFKKCGGRFGIPQLL